ncbi:MAG: DoxX family protein [Bacteroidetes bacterium]|nr:DoxX family protein [Bacteroidota bacterium]
MNEALWIMQTALCAFFLMAGIGKVTGTKDKHVADGHIKPNGSVAPIRILGVLELAGCVGIILPWLTGVVPVLTPMAGIGFCLVMASGMIVHVARKEYKMLPMLLAIMLMALIVAYCRLSSLNPN